MVRRTSQAIYIARNGIRFHNLVGAFRRKAEQHLEKNHLVCRAFDDGCGCVCHSATRLTEFVGKEYRMLWPLGAPGESTDIRYIPAGQTRNMTRSLLIMEKTLPAGTYYLEYEVDDMFMVPHVIEHFEYYWDGEKVIFPDGFVWEGNVLLN